MKRIVIFFVTLCLLVVFIVLSGVNHDYFKEHPRTILTTKDSQHENDQVMVFANITNIATEGVDLYLSFKIEGDEISEHKDFLARTPKKEILVTISNKNLYFEKDQMMSTHEVTLPWGVNRLKAYPFDTYRLDIIISAYIIENNRRIRRIPVTIYLENVFPGFELNVVKRVLEARQENEQEAFKVVSELAFDLNIKRSSACILWAGHTFFVNWMITCCVISLTTIYTFKHKVSPMIMSLVIGFMYALPVVRNSLFQVPPIGIDMDLYGFLWNELIVSCCVLKLISSYVYQSWKDHFFEDEQYMLIL